MGKYLEFNHTYTGEYITSNNDLIDFYTYPSGNTSTTISMWVYPISGGVILGEKSNTYYGSYNFGSNLEMNHGNMYFGFWDGANIVGNNSPITSSKWTYLTLTYNQSTGDMFGYINGVSACTANFVRVLPDYKDILHLYYIIAANIGPNLSDGGWSHMRLGTFRLFNYTLEPNEVEYEYLNSFNEWVCPVVYYNTENPQSYPGTGTGELLDDIEGNSQLILTGDSGLPVSATSLCNTYITFNDTDNQYGITNTDIKQYFNNNDVSIFMWVRAHTRDRILTELGQSSIGGSWVKRTIEMDGSYQFRFTLYDVGNTPNTVTSSPKNLEEWYYIGLTYNTLTSDLIGYVNGENIGTTNFTWYSPMDDGKDLFYAIATDGGSYWNGDIGTFQIWSQVLTPANVLNNYLSSVNNWICPIINYDISNENCYPNGYISGVYTVTDLSLNSDAYGDYGFTFYSGSSVCSNYLSFDSASSQFLITTNDVSTQISTNNDQSIFMWVKIKSDGSVLSELGQSTINTGFHYSQIEVFANTISVNILDTSPHLNTYYLGQNDFTWNYIGFTWKASGGEVITYFNGVSVATGSSISRDYSWTSNGLFYGIAAEDSGQVSDGYCDLDFGVFNLFGQTLTPEKVLDNYNKSFTKWICPVIKYDTNNYLCYTGGTEFFDLSGNGLDAGFGGSPSPTSGVSNCFTYVQFDGSNRFVANDSASYFPNNKFSLFMWVYPEDNGQIIDYYDGADTLSIVEYSNGIFIFGLYNGGGYDYFSASTPSTINTWHNVGVTYDGTTLIGYINGDITGSIATSWTLPGQLSFRSGTSSTSIQESGGFNGRMGTFEVWNKVLPYNVIYENYVNYINDITNFCPLLTLTVPSNETNITIPDFGVASSYPITFNVSGLIKPILDVTVTLSGYSHNYVDGIRMIIVAPDNTTYSFLTAGVGGGNVASNVDVVLSYTASTTWDGYSGGSFIPADTTSNSYSSFDSPAPSVPTSGSGNNLNTFIGLLPKASNGTWYLYIEDFYSDTYSGSLTSTTLTITQG